jgi:streptomycin 6-kinase
MDAPPAVVRVMAAWRLEADGAAFATHSSTLVPVRREGAALMLKLAHSLEEARGGRLMQAWGGAGAAQVLARRGPALLMERASRGSLAGLDDDAATRAIVAVAGRLRAGAGPLPRLVPLRRWFRALLVAREGVLGDCAAVARELLDDPRDEGVLHGDLHHGNVLAFGAAGWKAIDPKGLWGERAFEFAALFRNPDAGRALAPGRMERQGALVATLTGIAPRRVLAWVAAAAGLSAAWTLSDGGDAAAELALAGQALRGL